MLDLFEGERPDGLVVKVSGAVPGGQDGHALDETVWVLVKTEVGKVTHSRDRDGLLWRVEGAVVDRGVIVAPEVAVRVVEECAQGRAVSGETLL